MKISVITLFPDMLNSFFKESIISRAIKKKLVDIEIINLRDFAKDKYKTVDDRPYGGGAGMVLRVDCIKDAIDNVKCNERIVLTSPRGRVYDQSIAQQYSKLDHLVLIAGHYEGVDERVTNYIDEEVSLGDFVMTGGEITAAAIVDSIVRLIPGVLKKTDATEKESFFEITINRLIDIIGENGLLEKLKKKGIKKVKLLEYPQYTRPEIYNKFSVPSVLLSGIHAEIEKWKIQKAFDLTLQKRPDLLEQ